ncbi:MAG: hypothetical protein H7Y59_04545 [Anaerolineales bacterium]|nr:hypothetical protein [Anaerolineales bacterium]
MRMYPILVSFLSFVFVIAQQPASNSLFVSLKPNEVTQYSRVVCGSIALLADEYEAGVAVRQLKKDDIITVTFSDHVEQFQVTETRRYIAYEPLVVREDALFENVDTGDTITSLELGDEIYCGGGYHLAIQTCFDNAKGRFFVFAFPLDLKPERGLNIKP